MYLYKNKIIYKNNNSSLYNIKKYEQNLLQFIKEEIIGMIILYQ